MLAKIIKFACDKLLSFKYHRLVGILNVRRAISYEDSLALEFVHTIRKFSKEKQELGMERMAGHIDLFDEDSRIIRKILYQPGYLEEAERKYYDHIFPFMQKASWIYFLNPERLYNRSRIIK